MADSNIQLKVEAWIRSNILPEKFGMSFCEKKLKLQPGGYFNFDAVSDDNKIAISISTSSAKTSSGNGGTGKLLKLRSDMLFLHLCSEVDRRIILLVETDMLALCERQKSYGRVPEGIEFMLAHIPDDLRSELVNARRRASREVTPDKIEQIPDEILLSTDSE